MSVQKSGHAEAPLLPVTGSQPGNMSFLDEDFDRIGDRTLALLCIIPLGIGAGFMIPTGVKTIDTPEGLLRVIVGGMGAGIAFFAIIFALLKLTCMTARKRAVCGLKHGEYLANWGYAPQEWLDFVEYECGPGGRERKNAWVSSAIFFVLTPVSAIILALMVKLKNLLKDKARGEQTAFDLISFKELFIWCLVTCAILYFIICVQQWIVVLFKYRRLKREAGRVIIAENAIWFASLLTNWKSARKGLKANWVLIKIGITQPAPQHLSYLKIVNATFQVNMQNGKPKQKSFRFLLPRAHIYDFVYVLIPQLEQTNARLVVDHAQLGKAVPPGQSATNYQNAPPHVQV